MAKLKVEDLHRIKGEVLRSSVLEPAKRSARVTVHLGTCGISSGAEKVIQAMTRALAQSGRTDIAITTSGCAGMCNREPMVTIERVGQEVIKYAEIDEERAIQVFEKHVINGQVVTEWAFARGWEQDDRAFDAQAVSGAEAIPAIHDVPFFGAQELRVMRNRGLIQAESIDEAMSRDAYFAAAKALFQMSPDEIIQEVKTSGLRGRGGAGFPTGLKWDFAAKTRGETKYVLCNADEGDPGAFMDRCVLESDPHAVLEGMIIAARAIDAHRGYIYCRAEYPLAVKTLNLAIEQARAYGLLGKDVLGSGFDFDLEVYRGAGAFVCGEETALMTSIEGKRGMPRPRPPFPAVQGLWKKPTVLNNVETLASVPQIILNGGKWYASLGTPRSKGTKVFALTGDVNHVGLVEVPMGVPLGTIIYDIGGGISKGKKFKAVQLGGPSGGCIPAQHLNAPVDYDSITQLGAIVGSGGMIVVDEDKCIVDMARFFMEFCQDESCGKCTPCRVGTRKMREILTRICEGEGQDGDVETLERWADIIRNSSLCGLGQTAPNPVLSTIRYFREEYEAHIREKRCPAAVCANLFEAPCQHACPVEMDIPAYVALVRAGRFDDAYKVLLKTNPFSSVCGRVCDHPCEFKCKRSALDEPVHIKYLKRFITDHARRPHPPKVPVSRQEKIAVIGAGPSGMTAARDLALRGYAVTVFERFPEAGGMLRWGIPEYRLPREVLRRDIEDILALGVELRCNTRVGADVTWHHIQKQFDALYVAVGAQGSARLRAEGEDLQNVDAAVEFLRDFNLGKKPRVGQRVAVVGGGNSAIDASRCALRLGAAEVTLLYRRLRQDMPAQEGEIRAAEQEGVRIECLVAPARFLGDSGRVQKVVCQRMALAEFDASGRRRPVPVAGDQFSLEVDHVLVAIGQATDLGFIEMNGDIRVTKGGLIEIMAGTRTRASQTMIFAGGDVVSGPATVVKAIAAGRRAAAEIDSAIRRRHNEPPYVPSAEEAIEIPRLMDEEVRERPRASMPETSAAERIRDFLEVELGFSQEVAMQEACRCLRCDLTGEEGEPGSHHAQGRSNGTESKGKAQHRRQDGDG